MLSAVGWLNLFKAELSPKSYWRGQRSHWGGGPFCFTSTEARWLIRDGDRGKGDERVKARHRIPPEKDRRESCVLFSERVSLQLQKEVNYD